MRKTLFNKKSASSQKEKEVKKTPEKSNEQNNQLITAGDSKCYIYFDTEFTGLKKTTTLISIGLVDYDGRSFYAEFTDYNTNDVNKWIQSNVIDKLTHPETVCEGDHWTIEGTTEEIRVQLLLWLNKYKENKKLIQFVSDVCHYDFVLLIDLLLGDPDKTAIDLDEGISACCVDLNQDLATSIQRNKPDDMTEEEFNDNFVPAYAAFNINREEVAMYTHGFKSVDVKNKHNSLFDAQIIRALHQHLWNINN